MVSVIPSTKVLAEKFTRIDDPSTFTDKMTVIVPMTKVAGQLCEYACHEGNCGMANIVRGGRLMTALLTRVRIRRNRCR